MDTNYSLPFQSVLGSVRDATKLPEWDPEVSNVKYVTEALDTNGSSGKSPQFHHEVVTMDTNYIPNMWVDAMNHASQWLQGDVLVKKRKTLHRYNITLIFYSVLNQEKIKAVTFHENHCN